MRGWWQLLFRALVELTPDDVHIIDSTTAKAHRSAAGGANRSVARAGPRVEDRPVLNGIFWVLRSCQIPFADER